MSNKHGDFIWYELITANTQAAKEFYGKLLGWQFENGSQGEMEYWIALAPQNNQSDPIPVAGLLAMDPKQSPCGQSQWLGYIGVTDVEQSISQIEAAGGRTVMPATDIPGVGRIAMVNDPQGVPFYVMKSLSEEKSLAFSDDIPRPGHCAWNELMTPDKQAAWDFYSNQFNWNKDSEMDMGEQGSYDFIRHDFLLGAMMAAPPQVPPGWSYYFRVPQIDQAVETVKANGGKISLEPQPIPGDEFMLNGIDPMGASFCLVGVR